LIWMAAVGAFLAGGMVAGAFCYWHRRKTGSLQSALFASVPNPRQAVDAEGRTLYANPAFYEFFGGEDRPTPELLLKEVGDDEETHELIERLWANARTGVSGQAEISVPAKGGAAGGAFDWRLVVAHAVEGRPGVIYWAVDDITSRRQVEEVIREEQARFGFTRSMRRAVFCSPIEPSWSGCAIPMRRSRTGPSSFMTWSTMASRATHRRTILSAIRRRAMAR
jgi:two-component system cell cycle sensor histidine kinase/response regulator CckA